MQDHVLQVNVDLLLVTEAGRRREPLEVLVAARLSHDGVARIAQKLVVLTAEATLARSLRNHTLVQGVVLDAVLKQLRILPLRLQFHLFLRIQFGLSGLSLGC